MTAARDPTDAELAIIDRHLAELRKVFAVWSEYDDEYELICFAIYEGCEEPVMESAAPFACGRSLVRHQGFRWTMIQVGDAWHFGVTHPWLPEPIDLECLGTSSWNREIYDQPLSPGEITTDACAVIKLAIAWKQHAGADAPIPDDLAELEEKVRVSRLYGVSREPPRPFR